MKENWLVVLGLGLLLSGCSLTPKKSAVEIVSFPAAKVFLDDKEEGMTPYKNSSLRPGPVTVRLVEGEKEWQKKIELRNNVTTVIDWQLEEKGESGGYVLYMEKTGDEKKTGLLVNASPDRCAVAIDDEIKGFSPSRVEDIGEGDKKVTISFPGHKSINVFVKAIKGYQLVIEAKLVKEAGFPIEEVVYVEENELSTPSASLGERIKILPTETGWLRVREGSSSASPEVSRVLPGEEYELLEEGNGWYRIETGWISARYASKI